MMYQPENEQASNADCKAKVLCGICGKEVDIFEAWIADRIAICGECMREDHERMRSRTLEEFHERYLQVPKL
jgi:hypothetical protein